MTNNLRRFLSATLMVALTIALFTAFAPSARAQVPVLPQRFHGEVTAAGQPAPAGSVIEARGTGVKTGIPANPLVTSAAGKYGGTGAFDPKLLVQGTVTDGTLIEFYVNGAKAQVSEPGGDWRENYAFKTNVVVALNLRVLTDLPPAPPVSTFPTSTPLPPTATLPPPQTAVPTATQSPAEATATPLVAATAAPPAAQASPTGAAPIVATPAPTRGGAATTPIPASPTSAQAVSGVSPTPTSVGSKPVPSPAATATASTKPSVTPAAVAAGTARPTGAPILSSGAATPTRAAVDAPQETSRNLALGVGLVLVVAAAAIGIAALILRWRTN